MNESKELLKCIGKMITLADMENSNDVDMEKYQSDVEILEDGKSKISDVSKAIDGISSLTKDEIVSLIKENI